MSLQPESVVEVGRLWTVAVNYNQDLLGKTMLVLNRACVSVTDVRLDEWADLHRQIGRVTYGLNTLFAPDGYNFAFLMNQDPEVHLHVLPRYHGQRFWKGLNFEDAHLGGRIWP